MYCARCDTPVDSQTRFCSACGRTVRVRPFRVRSSRRELIVAGISLIPITGMILLLSSSQRTTASQADAGSPGALSTGRAEALLDSPTAAAAGQMRTANTAPDPRWVVKPGDRNFLPLVAGHSAVFQETTTIQDGQKRDTVEATVTITFLGQQEVGNYTVLAQEWVEGRLRHVNLWRRDDQGPFIYASILQPGYSLVMNRGRCYSIRFPIRRGDSWTCQQHTGEEVTYRVLGFEPVETPAGFFTESVRIHMLTFGESSEHWYAENVGLVQYRSNRAEGAQYIVREGKLISLGSGE
jgi:hypothetical protein